MMNKLRAYWSKKECDIIIDYPRACDGRYIAGIFNEQFEKDMISRGYDITSIKFSIKRNPPDFSNISQYQIKYDRS